MMKHWLSKLALIGTAWVMLSAAWPQSAHQNPNTDELMWFVVVTDSHIGQGLAGATQDSENLNWAMTELVQTVQPSFLVNDGDLVDATNGGLIPIKQYDDEWFEYSAIAAANGMNPDFYYDLPGNHDGYSEWPMDHYLLYSVQSISSQDLNHSWVRYDEKGNKYLFLGIATPDSKGSIPAFDDPGLDATDRQFMLDAIDQHGDAVIMVVMGHHPMGNLKEGEDFLADFLDIHASSAYIFGHTHDYDMWWDSSVLHINIRSLAKNDDRQVCLAAFDGLGFSTKVFDVRAWPQVLITTPVNSSLAGSHAYDYFILDSDKHATIRSLAFHPDGVESVTALLDDTLDIPMSVVAENVWQAEFDATQLAPGVGHKIKVTANAWGKTNSHEVTFHVIHDETPPPVDEDPIEYVEFVENDFDAISGEDVDFEVIEDAGPITEYDFEVIEDTAVHDFAPQDIPVADTGLTDSAVHDVGYDCTEHDSEGHKTDSSTGDSVLSDASDTGVPADMTLLDATPDSSEQDSSSDPARNKSGGCSTTNTAHSPAAALMLLLIIAIHARRRRSVSKTR